MDDGIGIPAENPVIVPAARPYGFVGLLKTGLRVLLREKPQVCQKKVRPFPGEGESRGGSDAMVCARDQGDLAFKSGIDHVFTPRVIDREDGSRPRCSAAQRRKN
jgi:hypothetical protein